MTDPTPEMNSLTDRTRTVIESFRPYIQADGGDIEFIKVEDGMAHVRLHGACCGCPHAAMTLKNGVERQLLARVPELKGVVNVA
jgi:Fe-S cluster biogenesis protein NfuA